MDKDLSKADPSILGVDEKIERNVRSDERNRIKSTTTYKQLTSGLGICGGSEKKYFSQSVQYYNHAV